VFRGSHLVLCVVIARLLPVVHEELDGVGVADLQDVGFRQDGEVCVAEEVGPLVVWVGEHHGRYVRGWHHVPGPWTLEGGE
jgi:hypothetical protein